MSSNSNGGGKGVTYKGLNELISFNKNLNKLLTDASNQAFRQQGSTMLGATQRVVPVKTGRLKRSGGQKAGNLFLSIFYDAPYALWVDIGTRRFAGRHYFFRILQSEETKVISAINTSVANMIRSHLGRK
jgi:hypothetical protein